MTDEERKKAEEEFDKEEAEIRNRLASRRHEQKIQTANAIFANILIPAIKELGRDKHR